MEEEYWALDRKEIEHYIRSNSWAVHGIIDLCQVTNFMVNMIESSDI